MINGQKVFYGWIGMCIKILMEWEDVQIKARRAWKSLVDDDSIVIVDSNNIEPKVVKMDDAYSL